ncbi:hypothetical protein FE257_010538 [Aspergillus nanangensis]|uniref:VWFA domain-containing protein n=1 Tax=Aspergillus nanangensis TaxID=2582783 RepID=A0AAD4CI82_ASPNN|nr:hypothetical protein FE257_010538 [Aspergillus nanangensis]
MPFCSCFGSSKDSSIQTASEPPRLRETSTMGHRHSRPSESQIRSSYRTEPKRTMNPTINHDHKNNNNNNNNDLWSPPPYSAFLPPPPTQPQSRAGSTASDSPYAFLREFDTIFVVDDSSSMLGYRWKEAEEAIAAIAPICTDFDHDGIDIYFLNHRNPATRYTTGAYMNVTTADAVRSIFRRVSPRGPTPFGRRLHEIMNPYMRRLERMMVAADDYGNVPLGESSVVKPLNIIAITDGEFTDDAQSIIVDVAKRLDAPSCRAVPWQVGIQFFQVGDDEAARAYLQALDDDLVKLNSRENLRDMVDTVPWRGEKGYILNADGILKCVLGAVNRKYDKQEVK